MKWSQWIALLVVGAIVVVIMAVGNANRGPQLIPATSCTISDIVAPGVVIIQSEGVMLAGPGGCENARIIIREYLDHKE